MAGVWWSAPSVGFEEYGELARAQIAAWGSFFGQALALRAVEDCVAWEAAKASLPHC